MINHQLKKIKNILLPVLLLVLYCLLPVAKVNAQDQDANLWMTIGIEKKIIQSLSVTLTQEFRMNENITELGTFLTDLEVTYKFKKFLRVSGGYRFINKRRLDDSYSKRHRYYFDLTLRKKFKPVLLTFRTRFQSQYTDIFSSDDGKVPSNYWRNKLVLKFDAGKNIEPYIYAEIYTPLKRPYNIILDRTRYCGGVEYRINRMNTIDLYYMFQKEYNINDPQMDHIIGIGYYLSL
jgi:hypothetical protein